MGQNGVSSEPVAVVILAAGLGKRMASELPKVMATADGQPLIRYVVESIAALRPERTVIVTGFKRELVEEYLSRQDLSPRPVFAHQTEQRGTGDAVKAALPALKGFTGTVCIIYGDVPLLTTDTLRALLERHHGSGATLTVLSVMLEDPKQYGRVVRSPAGEILRITEAKDCSPEEIAIKEINSGIYAVDSSFLPAAVEGLKNDNKQQEYYLTDIVARAAGEGQKLAALTLYGGSEVEGVNTRSELLAVEHTLRLRRLKELVDSGVSLADPASTFIDASVRIAPGAAIGPQVIIRGQTSIASGVIIDGMSSIEDSTLAEGVRIHPFSHLKGAVVAESASIGPFARLREGSVIGAEARIGNFVETKKTALGAGAKANHLTYLGDCTVGERSNIGAGTITCNYDGYVKSKTIIGAGAFIGSNTALVAPVTIGEGATVGAGSVITKAVEPDALALTRAPQESRPGWSKKKRERAAKK